MTAKTYLGKPCPKGHQDENGQNLRYTSNCGCVKCHSKSSSERKDGKDQEYIDLIIANRKEAKAKGEKHFLGGLCGRGHDHNGTGFSLKNTHTRSCVECKKLTDKSKRKLDKIIVTGDDIPDNFRLGQLCRRGHDYNGTGFSLRRICNNCCVECSRASAIRYERTRPPRQHSSRDAEIPPIPKEINHVSMTTKYDNRMKEIRRFEVQLKKEMAT